MLARSDWPEDFDEIFWETYPRRISKKAALKSLDKIRRSGEVPFEVLLSAVKVYARSVIGKDMKFVAHPATWLNAGRWDDDPDALVGGKVGASSLTESKMVTIRMGSPQAAAWEAWRGKPIPWGRSGMWMVSSEWPPNYKG